MTWDWEHAWAALAMAAVTGLLVFAGFALSAKHTVDGYYLEAAPRGGFCAIQSIQWDQDNFAFCSDDIDKTLRVVRDANASLVKK